MSSLHVDVQPSARNTPSTVQAHNGAGKSTHKRGSRSKNHPRPSATRSLSQPCNVIERPSVGQAISQARVAEPHENGDTVPGMQAAEDVPIVLSIPQRAGETEVKHVAALKHKKPTIVICRGSSSIEALRALRNRTTVRLDRPGAAPRSHQTSEIDSAHAQEDGQAAKECGGVSDNADQDEQSAIFDEISKLLLRYCVGSDGARTHVGAAPASLASSAHISEAAASAAAAPINLADAKVWPTLQEAVRSGRCGKAGKEGKGKHEKKKITESPSVIASTVNEQDRSSIVGATSVSASDEVDSQELELYSHLIRLYQTRKLTVSTLELLHEMLMHTRVIPLSMMKNCSTLDASSPAVSATRRRAYLQHVIMTMLTDMKTQKSLEEAQQRGGPCASTNAIVDGAVQPCPLVLSGNGSGGNLRVHERDVRPGKGASKDSCASPSLLNISTSPAVQASGVSMCGTTHDVFAATGSEGGAHAASSTAFHPSFALDVVNAHEAKHNSTAHKGNKNIVANCNNSIYNSVNHTSNSSLCNYYSAFQHAPTHVSFDCASPFIAPTAMPPMHPGFFPAPSSFPFVAAATSAASSLSSNSIMTHHHSFPPCFPSGVPFWPAALPPTLGQPNVMSANNEYVNNHEDGAAASVNSNPHAYFSHHHHLHSYPAMMAGGYVSRKNDLGCCGSSSCSINASIGASRMTSANDCARPFMLFGKDSVRAGGNVIPTLDQPIASSETIDDHRNLSLYSNSVIGQNTSVTVFPRQGITANVQPHVLRDFKPVVIEPSVSSEQQPASVQAAQPNAATQRVRQTSSVPLASADTRSTFRCTTSIEAAAVCVSETNEHNRHVSSVSNQTELGLLLDRQSKHEGDIHDMLWAAQTQACTASTRDSGVCSITDNLSLACNKNDNSHRHTSNSPYANDSANSQRDNIYVNAKVNSIPHVPNTQRVICSSDTNEDDFEFEAVHKLIKEQLLLTANSATGFEAMSPTQSNATAHADGRSVSPFSVSMVEVSVAERAILRSVQLDYNEKLKEHTREYRKNIQEQHTQQHRHHLQQQHSDLSVCSEVCHVVGQANTDANRAGGGGDHSSCEVVGALTFDAELALSNLRTKQIETPIALSLNASFAAGCYVDTEETSAKYDDDYTSNHNNKRDNVVPPSTAGDLWCSTPSSLVRGEENADCKHVGSGQKGGRERQQEHHGEQERLARDTYKNFGSAASRYDHSLLSRDKITPTSPKASCLSFFAHQSTLLQAQDFDYSSNSGRQISSNENTTHIKAQDTACVENTTMSCDAGQSNSDRPMKNMSNVVNSAVDSEHLFCNDNTYILTIVESVTDILSRKSSRHIDAEGDGKQGKGNAALLGGSKAIALSATRDGVRRTCPLQEATNLAVRAKSKKPARICPSPELNPTAVPFVPDTTVSVACPSPELNPTAVPFVPDTTVSVACPSPELNPTAVPFVPDTTVSAV